jgi:hypothetical protein
MKEKMQFAAMSRPKKGNEWNYMYFWAASQKEAEARYKDLKPSSSLYMDYKLERIKKKE